MEKTRRVWKGEKEWKTFSLMNTRDELYSGLPWSLGGTRSGLSRSGLSRGIGRHRRRRLSIERGREEERWDNDVEEREREISLYRSAS